MGKCNICGSEMEYNYVRDRKTNKIIYDKEGQSIPKHECVKCTNVIVHLKG